MKQRLKLDVRSIGEGLAGADALEILALDGFDGLLRRVVAVIQEAKNFAGHPITRAVHLMQFSRRHLSDMLFGDLKRWIEQGRPLLKHAALVGANTRQRISSNVLGFCRAALQEPVLCRLPKMRIAEVHGLLSSVRPSRKSGTFPLSVLASKVAA